MSIIPKEIRYLHADKSLLIRYQSGSYEFNLRDFYHRIYKKEPESQVYIEYIQESASEITFGFSDHRSITMPFAKLLNIAQEYKGSLANG